MIGYLALSHEPRIKVCCAHGLQLLSVPMRILLLLQPVTHIPALESKIL